MPQMILPIFSKDVTEINAQMGYAKREGMVYYFHGSFPIFCHEEKDLASFRMFTSQLIESGQCRPKEIVGAFGISVISVKRYIKKYREKGIRAFYKKRRSRSATVLTKEVLMKVQGHLNEGSDYTQAAGAVGIKADTVYKAIRCGKLIAVKKKTENAGITKSERSLEDSESLMGMGCTRVLERVLAATGKLEEAPSRFQLILDVPCAGVLWALPALLANGLLRHTKEYFKLPKGYYGLLHIFMLLAFMALSRVKSIEQLRYNSAGEWGNLLGLDRIPEVRTLRKRIRHLSETGQVEEWGHTLSKEWMANDPGAAGVLYVDGHVRVYHGSQTPLPRRYVSRERLCLRAMMDTWVNDQQGLPFFVVSTPFSAHLLEMLRDQIIPRLLNDVPHQPSVDELKKTHLLHRFTLVFDREGYSPDFLKEMKEKRIACLTYHKFPKEPWPVDEFQEQIIPFVQSQNVTLKLAERGTRLGSLWVREIRKLTETGHQTSLLSTDYLSNYAVLGCQMFSRWAQENFFKYMMEHFNIDALADFQTQPLHETKPVINPAHRFLDNQIKKEASFLGKKLGEFGRISLKEEDELSAVTQYERKKGTLKEQIDILQKSLEGLKEKRKITPKYISFLDLPPDEQFSQFSPTKKQMIDTIKMIAYRAETSMAQLIKESMAKPDEARSLLRDLFTMEADLLPNEMHHTLTVQLHHFTNPVSDKIIQSLADHLNLSETIYPGTNLRMIFKMVSS